MVWRTCFCCSQIIWVEREFSNRQTDLTRTNVTLNVTSATATIATQRCQPSQTWQAISISGDVTCVANGSVWDAKIRNLKLGVDSRHSVTSKAHCPLVSWILSSQNVCPTITLALCSCSWLYHCVHRIVTLELTAHACAFTVRKRHMTLWQDNPCGFMGLTVTMLLELSFCNYLRSFRK